ncbi:MAG: hypothetical protein NXI10_13485 [bacterium]|nr:hypothetical protein [bacterium]
MRNLLLILFLGLGTNVINAQSACIDLVNMNVLYRGVNNQVVVGISGYPDHSALVMIDNGELEEISVGVYTILPGDGKLCTISVYAKSDDSQVLLKKAQYRVSNLPDPTVYLGGKVSGNEVSALDAALEVRMSYQIPVRTNFTILNWEATYNDHSITGNTNDLQVLYEFISALEPGGTMVIKGKAERQDGQVCLFGGVWDLVE